MGNPQVARNINVSPGATLQFSSGNVLGGFDSAPQKVTISVTGGVVTSVGWNGLGPVVLTGGTLTGSSGGGTWGIYGFQGLVTATGSAASLITGGGASPFCNLAYAGTTTFEVDAGSTLTVAVPLAPAASQNSGGSLLKTGGGAMILNGSESYTGGTTISGGTLELSNLSTFPATGSPTAPRSSWTVPPGRVGACLRRLAAAAEC